MGRLKVLCHVNLLPETQRQVAKLVGEPVDFPGDGIDTSTQALIERAGDAEIVLASPGLPITTELLDACPTIKYVCLCGSSTANVDTVALKARNIMLTTVTHYGDEPTAEFILLQLGNLLRGLGKYQWKSAPHEFMGKRLGIVGLGAVGQAVAHLALAYKMNITYTGPHRKLEWEAKGLVYQAIGELLQTSDFVLLSGPGSMQVLSADDFKKLRNGSVLIQASQGAVFAMDAFRNWISRPDNFAIFDYAAGEENYQAYHEIERVIFPRIVAGYSHETKERLGELVVEDLRRYLLSSSI